MTKKQSSKEKSPAQNFAEALKDNPEEIIAWAKSEQKEYQRLIDILEKKKQ